MLKGHNRHKQYLEVAETLARRMIEEPRVEGIIFLGGLVRGFADQYSDLDVTVIISRRDGRLKGHLEDMARSVCGDASIDMDVEVHSVRDFSRLERTDWRRWEYNGSRVVFDRRGSVRKLVAELVTVPEDYWKDMIVRSWTYLQWYGCPAKGNKSIAEIWVDRGDAVSAHYCVNYSVDLLMDLLFALNHEFVPAPKWKLFAMRGLEWKPRGLQATMNRVLTVNSLDGIDLRRRVDALRQLNRQLERKSLEATGLSPDEFLRYFIERMVFETS